MTASRKQNEWETRQEVANGDHATAGYYDHAGFILTMATGTTAATVLNWHGYMRLHFITDLLSSKVAGPNYHFLRRTIYPSKETKNPMPCKSVLLLL